MLLGTVPIKYAQAQNQERDPLYLSDVTSASGVIRDGKFIDPQIILSPFTRNQATTRVIVNLKPPAEILARMDWHSENDMTQLRASVRSIQSSAAIRKSGTPSML